MRAAVQVKHTIFNVDGLKTGPFQKSHNLQNRKKAFFNVVHYFEVLLTSIIVFLEISFIIKTPGHNWTKNQVGLCK